MNITIKATGHDLTNENRALIEEKLSALDKFVGNDVSEPMLSVEIEESLEVVRSGAKYRAEGNLSVNGKLFRAEATNETLEGAVDRVRDELSREVKRANGKSKSLLKRGGASIKNMLRFGR